EFCYHYKLTGDFSDNTVATLCDDMRTLKIYAKNSNSAGKLIATFKVFDVGASTDDMSGFSTLESYNQYIYTFKIEHNPPTYIDENMIKENFALNDVSA
ncbi:MAG: hypothetical protein J1E41_05905, partial [Ruminococcus sp.]|nr:hypothetical protein [Ruminococcus sp.]